ncbi:MAG: S-adenosyl-l-methionine hydroxide adenosyltransferase family protein [Pseudomonadota bacterium]
MRRTLRSIATALCALSCLWLAPAAVAQGGAPNGVVVYQSDFGLKDGAVSAMRGVAVTVDPSLRLENLTHEIPAFDIWQGAYRLNTTAPYWPAGTVFVSVVDPGVGTDRKSVVLKTKSGHYFVSPDNGTLTLVAEDLGIDGVREIDESQYRRPGSEQSYTFHGRDVYSYAAAHLASGKTAFEDIGPELPAEVVAIDYQKPAVQGEMVAGNIPILDVQFGNVWTNIDRATFEQLGVDKGTDLGVKIFNEDAMVFEGVMPFVSTFGDVPQGDPLLYMNSVDNLSAAINWGDFAGTHGIESGPSWRIEVAKQ